MLFVTLFFFLSKHCHCQALAQVQKWTPHKVKVYVVCLFDPFFFFLFLKSAVVFSDLTHHSSTKPSPAGLSEWSTWWRIYWTTMENAIGNFFSEKMITGLEAVKWQLRASCQTSVLKNHARQQIESQNNYSPPLHY